MSAARTHSVHRTQTHRGREPRDVEIAPSVATPVTYQELVVAHADGGSFLVGVDTRQHNLGAGTGCIIIGQRNIIVVYTDIMTVYTDIMTVYT